MDLRAALRRVFLCPLGRHERSRGKARLDGPDITSVCRYCGVPMRKDADEGWVVDRQP